MKTATKPFWGSKRPKCENFHFWDPFWIPLSPGTAETGRMASKTLLHSVRHIVRHIHIIYLGPLTDLNGTPGSPKRSLFDANWNKLMQIAVCGSLLQSVQSVAVCGSLAAVCCNLWQSAAVYIPYMVSLL